MNRQHRSIVVWIVACMLAVASAHAAINVRVQPRHLFDGYAVVACMTVTSIDADTQSVEMSVDAMAKGAFEVRSVVIRAAEGEDQLESILSLSMGQRIVAFIGQKSGRSTNTQVLYYVGGGKWFRAVQTERHNRWTLAGHADQGKNAGSIEIMFAVFNGSVGKLWELMTDMAAGRDYFPAAPFTRFEERPITQLDQSVHGVGIADVDGDGALDLVATSMAGVHLFLQQPDGQFVDRTDAYGLGGTKATSISAADADADGDVDLLLDATVLLNDGNRFTATNSITVSGEVVSAAFVELNEDGLPDVIISLRDGGLKAMLNPGQPLATHPFADATSTLNLPENVRNGSGYFEPGDWNGDGRTDLFYLAGPGYLLRRKGEGFDVCPLGDPDSAPEFGTAAIAPIVTPDRAAALLVVDANKWLLLSDLEGIDDITRFGNELQEDVPGGRMVLAEDLNADGTVDLYIASAAEGSPALFALNRGYGSFMQEEKYNSGRVFPPGVYGSAVHGLACGDVNGDGAIDLLVGGKDGRVTLLLNRTLDDRPDKPGPSSRLETQKQIAARLVTIVPTRQRGVVGAGISLVNAQGNVVDSRMLGSNVGVGCTSAPRTTLVAREPGPHHVKITYADGTQATALIDLGADRPRHQVIRIGE